MDGGVVGDSVGAIADWDGGDNFAVIVIEDDHPVAVADREEAMVLGVDGEAGRRLSGDGPMRFDGHGFRIDMEDFVFVFDVDEDIAFAIGDGEFGLPPT